jgi:hypothetical protein
MTIKTGNLRAIAYHLEQGHDNGNVTREALAEFLRGVADELESLDNRPPGLGAFKDAAELEGLTIKPKERKR